MKSSACDVNSTSSDAKTSRDDNNKFAYDKHSQVTDNLVNIEEADTLEDLSIMSSNFHRFGSAVFYGVASFLVMVVNKNVLTVHQFPSFQVVGMGQMVSTVVILWYARRFHYISFPNFSWSIFQKIWPLSLLFLGNMLFGLGGTQSLSLPMMTVLRRFSIVMTMALEWMIFHTRPSFSVQIAVYLMIFGAIVAAFNDLGFNLKGYLFILMNDLTTAGNGVMTKMKLETNDLDKYCLIYNNSLLMLMPTLMMVYVTGDLKSSIEFDGWNDVEFLFQFLLSCMLGFVLTYSTILCTHYNSALTTTVIGCIKNILITYMGMVIGGDYTFNWWNFVGLSISSAASVLYTYKVLWLSKSS